ncbi:Hsp20/alpha crystallin family protein [Dactylosporangium sp. NPDC051541]|uniref:Hsp20/alpha crystallin family protein n=1 Tax=Dactylosporangium sp. NPDC051541 TaxID=3363977 RepID=UPI00378F9284
MTLVPFSSRPRRGALLAGAPAYRWDPRREVDELNSRFGQLIQSLIGGETGIGGSAGWSPPVDVEETEDAYIVDVDLPNVNPRDVDLEMRGEELRISGAFEERGRGGVVRRQGRRTGEFEYMIDLPSDIDSDQVQASYSNGVLTVTVPKARDAQPRRIEIQAQRDQQSRQGIGQQETGQQAGQSAQRTGQPQQTGQQAGQSAQRTGQPQQTGQQQTSQSAQRTGQQSGSPQAGGQQRGGPNPGRRT